MKAPHGILEPSLLQDAAIGAVHWCASDDQVYPTMIAKRVLDCLSQLTCVGAVVQHLRLRGMGPDAAFPGR